MARRIPIYEPHLRTTDEPLTSDPRVRRNQGVVPHQSTLSVQNIPDTSTPAGTAMVNEEFRRLRLAVEGLKETKDIVPTTPETTTPTTNTDTPAALTALHNDGIEVGNQVQLVNFDDSNTVMFELSQDVTTKQWGKYIIDQTLANPELNLKKPQKVNITAHVKERFRGITGTVYVNQLVVAEPISYPDEDTYKYYPKTYDPAHGKYGWYVYQTIQHNLGLSNKDSYIMELIDLHDYDDTDGLMPAFYAARFETQQGIFEHEGLSTNKLIIRAIFKPDLHYYYGTMLPQSLEYLDAVNGIVRTNLIFRYTIIKVN